jgi:hypothetical protein
MESDGRDEGGEEARRLASAEGQLGLAEDDRGGCIDKRDGPGAVSRKWKLLKGITVRE